MELGPVREHDQQWDASHAIDQEIEHFKRAVDSVLTQECSLPMELIVVDDGSIAPLCEQPALATIFQRQNVTSIRLSRNAGLVFALNAGLASARHDLIANDEGPQCRLMT